MNRVLLLIVLVFTVIGDARAELEATPSGCTPPIGITGTRINLPTDLLSITPSMIDAIEKANANPECVLMQLVNSLPELPINFLEFEGIGAALPLLTGSLAIERIGFPINFLGGGAGSDFRFINIGNGGSLWVDGINFTDFHTTTNGGVFQVSPDATLVVFNSKFFNNFAEGNGGVVSADADSVVIFDKVMAIDNTAGEDGGVAHSISPLVAAYVDSIFIKNLAKIGGAVSQNGGSYISVGNTFDSNFASRRGGAESARKIRTLPLSPQEIFLRSHRLRLLRESAEFRDNIIRRRSPRSYISENRYKSNSAGSQIGNSFQVQVDPNQESPESGTQPAAEGRTRPAQDGDPLEPEGFLIAGNVFSDPFNFVNTQYLRIEGGDVRLENNTFNVDPSRNQTAVAVVNFNQFLFGSNFMSGNAFGNGWEPRAGVDITGAACREIGTISGTPLLSEGFNVVADFTCPLDGAGDRPGTDPLFDAPDGNGIVALLDGSPAIDSGPSTVGAGGRLPCGHVDIRGVARPQDGNGDGTAACDAGAWEKHRGPDLGTPLTGLYFDVTRNGEGIVVEMLPGGEQALVYVFTYRPDGDGQAWMIGVGEVTHNSVVVNDLRITTSGTPFGAGFDPAQVERIPWGALSLSLPECAVLGAERGVLSLTGNGSLGFEALISRLNRLTWVVDCDGGQSPGARLSGSLFDPARDGEGLIVQILPDGRALVQVYTYGPSGEQFWIQGVGMLVNDTVSVDDAFFTRGPAYGSAFDPADLEIVPWGAFDIVFDGCAGASFAYDSTVPGFGSGMWNLVRLTEIEGARCSQ